MTERRVFTIPAGTPFVDTLVSGIVARVGTEPGALGDVTVFLANQRAVSAVRDTFLRHGDGRPMILPRLRPLGEVDDADEMSLASPVLEVGEEVGEGGDGLADLPPAISSVRRHLLLTRMVQAFAADRTGAFGHADVGQAAHLAAELASLLDSLQIEEIEFDALRGLVPARFAEHWQRTIVFLEILGVHWPAILEAEGRLDPKHRRRLLIDRQIDAWGTAPPTGPVIVAGSTGSQPATARLIRAVAGMKHGAVVLPGLDEESDDDTFRAYAGEATHPQHGLARLLETLGVDRREVGTWDEESPVSGSPQSRVRPTAPRARLLVETMRPAATTDAWRGLAAAGTISPSSIEGLRLLECADSGAEAQAVAMLLREQVENRELTAALVTPDRTLARRVASQLRRWGIEVDDTAGQPLSEVPVMTFWRATAGMVRGGLAPSLLLSAFKHPFAAGGLAPSEFRRRTRALERLVLRGPRPAPTIDGLIAATRDMPDFEIGKRGMTPAERDALADWLEALASPLRALEDLLLADEIGLAEIVTCHTMLCEALATTDEETGAEVLWRGDAGNEAATFLTEVLEWAEDHPPIAGADYLPLLDALLAGRSHHKRWRTHPRIAILGLIEARLQQADLMILGGLNEGTWPPEPPVDPWMSRPMRAAVGLPPPERRIGLTAHDFATAAAAPSVVLTRAERVDGAPTVPSRWLLRLKTVLDAVGLGGRIDADAPRLLARAARLDAPMEFRPAPPPEPRPPLAARPREFSVTQVETLMRDPYAIYARKVLGLEALDPLDADPGAAERGEIIHAALDRFVKAYPDRLPPDALERLLAIGHEVFAPLMSRPDVASFWWPRFQRIAGWFVATEVGRRPTVERVETEQRGSIKINAPAGPVSLKAFADRIDRRVGGGYAIVDYKTGGVPHPREVLSGLSPQLPLEAVIVEAGGFPALPANACEGLEYWQLSGGEPAGRIIPVNADIAETTATARAGLEAILAAFDDPATPYLAVPDPDLAPRYNDYAHLERLAEWASIVGGEE